MTKSTKFNKLRIKTSEVVQQYKGRLSSETHKNKLFTANFQLSWIEEALDGDSRFLVFARVMLPHSDFDLEKLFPNLPFSALSYLVIRDPEILAKIAAQLSSPRLNEGIGGSALLLFNTDNEQIYRKIVAVFLAMEQRTSSDIFSLVQLILTKERDTLVSFSEADANIRSLYQLTSTKESILLEIFSALNSPASQLNYVLDAELASFGLSCAATNPVFFPFRAQNYNSN